jgi:hypothetical protein
MTFSPGPEDGQIRETSSSGNTVNATFGGFNAKTGIHMKITINDPAIKISNISIQFFGTT